MSKSTAASLRFGTDFALTEDNIGAAANSESKNNNTTVRLQLELFQTDTCTYPEFNYSKLLHLEKKKMKKLKHKTNGDLVDDDVARIAKELEKKYGTTYGSGRGGRNKKDDHCDIGLGYDESDSFIDNTEAYDEVIPEEVETIEGGFYINCGALEFKNHSESTTTKTDEIIKMPNRPKKRILSTSSEDSSTSGEEDEEDENSESEAEESDTDTDATITNGKSNKAASSGGGGGNNGNVPKEKHQKKATAAKKSQENGKKKDKGLIEISGSSSNSPRPTADELGGSDSEKERNRQQKTVKTTTVKDMLKAKRDSFLKMQTGNSSAAGTEGTKTVNGDLKGPTVISADDNSSSSDSADDSAHEAAIESDSNESTAVQRDKQDKKAKKSANTTNSTTNNEDNTEKLRSSDTKLPELEAEVVTSILEFKETVKTKNMTGKKFQFDENLTEVFLRIDESLLCIEKTQRNMVFAHLEYHLLLPKYFFLRKAKQLRIKEEKLKSKRSLGKLRKAVIETMPGAIANYEVELRKNAEQETNMSVENSAKMPKKKFPWNSNLRNLLYEVYQVRWTSYPVLGTRKETLEDFINVYLRDKVVEIWPNGWMRYEDLQKEIEKSKPAKKKAKEKKIKTTTTKSAPAVATQLLNAAAAVAKTASISAPAMPQNTTFTSTSSSAITMTIAATSNSYMKQFEEFATISTTVSGGSGGGLGQIVINPAAVNANSDTDSVASSSASASNSGAKRKNTDSSKHGRSKTQKTNKITASIGIEQQQQQQRLVFDLLSPTKRVEPNAILFPSTSTSISPVSAATTTTTSHVLGSAAGNSSSIFSNQNLTTTSLSSTFSSAATMLQSQKHSNLTNNNEKLLTLAPNVRVIDLDKFKCTSDILETSKQLMNSATPSVTAGAAAASLTVRDSSSESDGVEIVGFFPAKPNTVNKQKYNTKRNDINQQMGNVSSSSTSINKFSVDAINNNKAAADFDVVKVVNVLKELEDQQHLQPKANIPTTQNASTKDQKNQ